MAGRNSRSPGGVGHSDSPQAGRIPRPPSHPFENPEGLRAIFRDSPLGIALTSLDFQFLDANPALLKMLGHSLPEILGKTFAEITFPADLPESEKMVHAMMEGRISNFHLEKRYIQRSGEILWARTTVSLVTDDQGRPVCILATLEDIHEKKRAEQALLVSQERLRASEKLYRHLVENIEEKHFIYSHDLDGVFNYLSPSIGKILGYSEEEFKTHFTRFLTENPVNLEVERHTSLSIQGVKQPAYEVEIYHKNRTKVWLEVSETPIFDDRGRVTAVQGIARDITDRKNAEEDRRKLQQQIQHVQKLESLGILAGGIAHDFNNILQAILGNVEITLASLPADAPRRRNLLEVQKAAFRAARLAQQMLAYSGKGRFEVKSIDLDELILETTKILEASISKKIAIRFQHTAGLPTFRGDPTQVAQIILNLVLNSAEAIGKEAGFIDVMTGTRQCDREFLQKTWLDENLPEGLYVYLEVADSGIGMSQETLTKIFDPFFSTKFAGRGLGLAAVLGIVRGHRGAVQVVSELGRGTRFSVFFPVDPAQPRETPVGNLPAEMAVTEGVILLVDDEDLVLQVGMEMLDSLGFRVLIARNGKEALRVFDDHSQEIVCVILDLTMPEMDGEEACREFRRRRSDIPILLSSGYCEEDVSGRFQENQLTGFIEKPYNVSTLGMKIQEALRKGGKGSPEPPRSSW